VNRLFVIENFSRVPDGTLVAPFLNARDSHSGLPAEVPDNFSIAAGIIEPGVSSKIHVMPLVTQVTFVLQGSLEIHMKDAATDTPYSQYVSAHQAVLTRPGTFFQLINHAPDIPCQVLYMVSPAYIFLLAADGALLYDDAVVLDEDWQDLAVCAWQPPALQASKVNPDTRAAAAQQFMR
jgi:hypothetical protein